MKEKDIKIHTNFLVRKFFFTITNILLLSTMKQNNTTFKAIFLVVFSFFVFALKISAQEKQFKVATVAFYNLENLFDTIDTPDKNDFEYTPESDKKWDSNKYWSKQNNMAEVIVQIGADLTKTAPAILGVCEVENRLVLEDLVKTPELEKYAYGIVHYESPDKRGIDVALLYQPAIFKVTDTKSATLKVDGMDDFYTRDQLVVSGYLDGEKMHFIVNHWPSRSGGEKRSRPLRNAAADLTRSLVDSIFSVEPDAKIIVMGDLNDDPINESLLKHLKAEKSKEKTKEGELYNTTYPLFQQGVGTLAYRDKWNLFDQIIISHSLLGDDKSSFKHYKTAIFNRDFLKQESGQYKGYPFRTHAGGVYKNGYSDHFPVYIYLIKEVK